MSNRTQHPFDLHTHRTQNGPSDPCFAELDLPVGLIWPPQGGRELLAEVLRHDLHLESRANGEWAGHAGDWLLYLAAGSRFQSPDAGRRTLLEWAGWHTEHLWLSTQRILVLAPQADGSALLWQAVRAERTLLDRLTEAFEQAAADEVAAALAQAADRLVHLHREAADTGLKISITNTSDSDRPTYLGLAPTVRGLRLRPVDFTPRALAPGEPFSPLFDGRLTHCRSRFPAIGELLSRQEQKCADSAIAAQLGALADLLGRWPG